MDLVADLGGTNVRFGLVDGGTLRSESVERYKLAAHGSLEKAIRAYLEESGRPAINRACLAVATVVKPGQEAFNMVNVEMDFSRASIGEALGTPHTHFLNDWEAIGYAVGGLGPADWAEVLAGQQPSPTGAVALCGTGTGLGTCFVKPAPDGREVVVSSHASHMSLAPRSADQRRVHTFLEEKFGHVSWERLLSGPGLADAHQALHGGEMTPEQVTESALAGDACARRTVACFMETLAHYAGNLALICEAWGGVYLGGGVLEHLYPLLEKDAFKKAFQDKGRFRSLLEEIPVRRLTHPDPALFGAARFLALYG